MKAFLEKKSLRGWQVALAVVLIGGWLPFTGAAAEVAPLAQQQPWQPPQSSLPQHTLEIGLNTYHFSYAEELAAPLKSTESGWLVGPYLDYTIKQADAYFLQGSLQYAKNDLTYDGSARSGTPVTFSAGNQQEFYSLQGAAGLPSSLEEETELIPYFGVAYNHWSRGAAGNRSGFISYKEVYTWWTALLGLKLGKMIMDNTSLSLKAEIKYNFGGQMQVFNAEAGLGDDLVFSLGSLPGYLLEVCLRRDIGSGFSASLTPWYESYSFGESGAQLNTKNGGYYREPSSTSDRYGVKIGVGYSF